MNKVLRNIFVCLLTVAVFAGYGVALVSGSYTLTNLWVVWSVTLFLAIFTSFVFGKKIKTLTGIRNIPANQCIYTIALTGIICGTFLFGNQVASPGNIIYTDKATISRIYTKTRYRSKRVAPRRYVNSDKYTVWRAELTFSNGCKRHIDIPVALSRKLHADNTIDIPVIRGFFGMPFYHYPDILKHNINK